MAACRQDFGALASPWVSRAAPRALPSDHFQCELSMQIKANEIAHRTKKGTFTSSS